jgi:hypothetical protein
MAETEKETEILVQRPGVFLFLFDAYAPTRDPERLMVDQKTQRKAPRKAGRRTARTANLKKRRDRKRGRRCRGLIGMRYQLVGNARARGCMEVGW